MSNRFFSHLWLCPPERAGHDGSWTHRYQRFAVQGSSPYRRDISDNHPVQLQTTKSYFSLLPIKICRRTVNWCIKQTQHITTDLFCTILHLAVKDRNNRFQLDMMGDKNTVHNQRTWQHEKKPPEKKTLQQCVGRNYRQVHKRDRVITLFQLRS